MGEVFEAKSPRFGLVAVKVLHAHLEDRPDIADRMRLEAEILAHLRHPNIVELFEVGATTAGRPFLAMEYIAGPTLLSVLKERPRLVPDEAVGIACEALGGLAVAHEAGVIHRDVKPGNLFLLEAGAGVSRVKLVDFGIAKLVTTVGIAGAGPSPLLVPTAKGTVVGTPRYLSPEQIAGRPIDARADLYAMGLVLYRMLVGKGPFDDIEDFADLMRAQVKLMPPFPSSHGVAIARRLDLVVMKALAKRPEDRFTCAAEFARELGRSLTPATTRSPATRNAAVPEEDLEVTRNVPNPGAPPVTEAPGGSDADDEATVARGTPRAALPAPPPGVGDGAEAATPWATNRTSVVLAVLLALTWLGLAVNWAVAAASGGR